MVDDAGAAADRSGGLPDLSRAAIERAVLQARSSVTAYLHSALSSSSSAVSYSFQSLLSGFELRGRTGFSCLCFLYFSNLQTKT
jgi:hypothetical protein